MAGRYVITGVQLGMLMALDNREERIKLAEKIEDEQYLGHSTEDIKIFVSKYAHNNNIPVRTQYYTYFLTAEQYTRIVSYIKGGLIIDAIKYIREAKQLGLKESKDICDVIKAEIEKEK